MNIITKANKLDRSYDFYIRHKMHAVEWKLNALINKDKSLINNLNLNWRRLLKRKFESYCVWSITQINKFTRKICSNLSNNNLFYYL